MHKVFKTFSYFVKFIKLKSENNIKVSNVLHSFEGDSDNS